MEHAGKKQIICKFKRVFFFLCAPSAFDSTCITQCGHSVLSWLGGSGASFLCRGEVDEVSLVGEGEAEESLPPPSGPDGTEDSCGTGGAFFLPRNPPSSTPFFFEPLSAFATSPPDPAPSSSEGCERTLRLTSPPTTGLSGGCRGDSWPLTTTVLLELTLEDR